MASPFRHMNLERYLVIPRHPNPKPSPICSLALPRLPRLPEFSSRIGYVEE